MRKYNFIRPLMILIVAYLVNNLASNVSLLLGASQDAAANIGIIAMIVAALVLYTRMTRQRRNGQGGQGDPRGK
ncbi:hypothetical protein IDH44_07365 [Paenibacillus sp. IB182496]|uniref:Uncharacterized protein n=1 Tax=Paenibacillus sabuli TaxID=2772509 RepID=A0A927BT27_9BACL|nr:hypothetical protein [Paenibacillus sabuli]MBD2845004.1 hypothetical protein [Paenibacillus sabuli]